MSDEKPEETVALRDRLSMDGRLIQEARSARLERDDWAWIARVAIERAAEQSAAILRWLGEHPEINTLPRAVLGDNCRTTTKWVEKRFCAYCSSGQRATDGLVRADLFIALADTREAFAALVVAAAAVGLSPDLDREIARARLMLELDMPEAPNDDDSEPEHAPRE